MSDLLRQRPATTAAMLAVWDDAATVAHALAFEAELARASAAEGLLPAAAAEAIAAACDAAVIDPVALADETALAGTLGIPLVARLRAMLPADIAPFVHHGSTSQDLADTVLMMQASRAARLLMTDLARVRGALSPLALRHAATPAIGRTLLQDALPISFGVRIAQWSAGIDEASDRLDREIASAARVQLGGAAGTRSGLGGRGGAVARRMADALDLAPAEPWHVRRAGVAAIAAAIGIVVGVLAKMARDLSLLAQAAVGEAREPLVAGRGGSSAMAHKRNPTGCQVALAAAHRAPGLVAAILTALPAEQERGLGGWQAEGPALADLFLLAAGSAAALADVAEGLEIDEAAIARNLLAANVGDDIGESVRIVAALVQEPI